MKKFDNVTLQAFYSVRMAYQLSDGREEFVDFIAGRLFSRVHVSDKETVSDALRRLINKSSIQPAYDHPEDAWHAAFEDTTHISDVSLKTIPESDLRRYLEKLAQFETIEVPAPSSDENAEGVAMLLSFSAKGFGFGQLSFQDVGDNITVDNEAMSKNTVHQLLLNGIRAMPSINDSEVTCEVTQTSRDRVYEVLDEIPCTTGVVAHACDIKHFVIAIPLQKTAREHTFLTVRLCRELLIRGLKGVLPPGTSVGQRLDDEIAQGYGKMEYWLGKLKRKGINLDNYIVSAETVTYTLINRI